MATLRNAIKLNRSKMYTTREIAASAPEVFFKELPRFQRRVGRKRDLNQKVRSRLNKLKAKFKRQGRKKRSSMIFLSLYVNHISANKRLVCLKCGGNMRGNGRSFKFNIMPLRLRNGRQITEIQCILCPQQCCDTCQAAGCQYCHKEVPEWVMRGRCYAPVVYEQGVTGDPAGTCLLSDDACIRLARDFACLLTRWFPSLGDLAAMVARARGFQAVTDMVRQAVEGLFGRGSTGWYAGLYRLTTQQVGGKSVRG